jgi:chemotaxis protein methyltransferase CheR
MTFYQEVTADTLSPELSPSDFLFFRDLIFQLSGIHLTEKKRDLLLARLRSHIEKNKIGSFADYRALLENVEPNHPELQRFVNLMTTNKTDFFREPKHFNFIINDLIPYFSENQKTDITIWSCASSTGEEPYTLSMVFSEHLPQGFQFKILATDIDTQVLSKAQNGVYPISKLSEIPEEYQGHNLNIGHEKVAGWFKISDSIHKKITFQQHNLIENSSLSDEKFDIIFCRNVLIYFTPETIRALMLKLHRTLKRDGLLFIGHSESIQSSGDLFTTVSPAIFRKKEGS